MAGRLMTGDLQQPTKSALNLKMEENKHRIGFKKILYACDFCGKDVIADCVIEVEVEANTVPVFNLTRVATISHRCEDLSFFNTLLKEVEWEIQNNA